LAYSGDLLGRLIAYEKKGPGELADFQRSSKIAHPHVKGIKQRWQEASVDEQGAPE